MEVLGIDVGGSGIKGAIVNTITGELMSERHRIETPRPAKPESMAAVVKEIVQHFNWTGKVGCGFPTVIINGQCKTAGNLNPEWIGVQVDKLFSEYCGGLSFTVGNDADVAGVAEMTLGAGKGKMGTTILITIGTGIGSGFFHNGVLVPNIELGRIFHTNGKVIESYAADSARKREGLKTKAWAKRFDFFLNHIKLITGVNHIILGGGQSKKFHKFKDVLTVDVPVEPAKFLNNAGIIGAALYAR